MIHEVRPKSVVINGEPQAEKSGFDWDELTYALKSLLASRSGVVENLLWLGAFAFSLSMTGWIPFFVVLGACLLRGGTQLIAWDLGWPDA